jgi:hypothetical protein
VRLDLPYLTPDPDRHGNDRLYVRKNGRKIRIRETPGTPEFLTAYSEALEALDGPASWSAKDRRPRLRARWAGWRPVISARPSSRRWQRNRRPRAGKSSSPA